MATEEKIERWVELHEKFDYRVPGKRSVVAFPPGRHFMTIDQAREAYRLGKGKPSPKSEQNAD